MGLFVSTTGTNVVVPELGITIVHPAIDFQLDAQFSSEELEKAVSITNAITSGVLIWKKTAGGSVETPSSYDKNFVEVEDHAEGPGSTDYRLVRVIGALEKGRVPSWDAINNRWVPSSLINFTSYRPQSNTTTTTLNGTLVLTESSNYLQIIEGTQTGFSVQLPDATTLLNGWGFTIHNSSTQTITVKYNDGSTFIVTLNPNSRTEIYLSSNATTNGVWIRTIQSSSAFQGTAPILAFYGGNANTGRYLEIYPSEPSNTGPILIPANSIIIAMTLASSAATTATVGVFKTTNLVTPIATISLVAQTDVALINLNVPVNASDKLAIQVTSGALAKPRFTMYVSGA